MYNSRFGSCRLLNVCFSPVRSRLPMSRGAAPTHMKHSRALIDGSMTLQGGTEWTESVVRFVDKTEMGNRNRAITLDKYRFALDSKEQSSEISPDTSQTSTWLSQ